PAPPDVLRPSLAAAVDDAALSLPDHLALLGERLLARVAGRSAGGRELALDLLAADAFITYAFEAQAEADVAGLAALAGRVGAGDGDGGAGGGGSRCAGRGRGGWGWWPR